MPPQAANMNEAKLPINGYVLTPDGAVLDTINGRKLADGIGLSDYHSLHRKPGPLSPILAAVDAFNVAEFRPNGTTVKVTNKPRYPKAKPARRSLFSLAMSFWLEGGLQLELPVSDTNAFKSFVRLGSSGSVSVLKDGGWRKYQDAGSVPFQPVPNTPYCIKGTGTKSFSIIDSRTCSRAPFRHASRRGRWMRECRLQMLSDGKEIFPGLSLRSGGVIQVDGLSPYDIRVPSEFTLLYRSSNNVVSGSSGSSIVTFFGKTPTDVAAYRGNWFNVRSIPQTFFVQSVFTDEHSTSANVCAGHVTVYRRTGTLEAGGRHFLAGQRIDFAFASLTIKRAEGDCWTYVTDEELDSFALYFDPSDLQKNWLAGCATYNRWATNSLRDQMRAYPITGPFLWVFRYPLEILFRTEFGYYVNEAIYYGVKYARIAMWAALACCSFGLSIFVAASTPMFWILLLAIGIGIWKRR